MTKNYRLLKDHPYAKAGTVVEENCREDSYIQVTYSKTEHQGNAFNIPISVIDEWLEPVETRWRPKKEEEYFLILLATYSENTVDTQSWVGDTYDGSAFATGNCFRTREQAEEAAKRVKETLHKYHEEIGE